MPKNIHLFIVIILLMPQASCQVSSPQKGKRILVFTRTAGFYHSSIPEGIAAIKKIGISNNYKTDVTSLPEYFTPDSLAHYNAVLFLNTTGDVLNTEQQQAFETYIKNGGGFVGIHAAADTEHNWTWYTGLVGAKFAGHPNNPNVFKATISITDPNFIAAKGLPQRWERVDEWYNYSDISTQIKVIAILDESSYTGGTNGTNHPIAWYHSYDGGRAFYTGLGHTEESYTEPLFLQHLEGGIKYAAEP